MPHAVQAKHVHFPHSAVYSSTRRDAAMYMQRKLTILFQRCLDALNSPLLECGCSSKLQPPWSLLRGFPRESKHRHQY